MKPLFLPDETAAALQILLSNLSPMALSNTAQKCATLYGGDELGFYRRLTNAADDTVKALKDRDKIPADCKCLEMRVAFESDCG